MKAVCISASNILRSKNQSTSLLISEQVSKALERVGVPCEIVDLRNYSVDSCNGCGLCFNGKRCVRDAAFNEIYEKMVSSDAVFFVSPHYAPIPAKLTMVLEKMEQIAFLHWWKDTDYQSELNGLPVGIISHGGGGEWALASYKAMVNDTIANALDTAQCTVIPYNEDWNTGISLPVMRVAETESIFPVQEYDWETLKRQINDYVKAVAALSKAGFN